MAELFQPKFVDLVRNNTTTTGTADFVVGAATMGFTSFTAACAVGDQFYYSAIGIDKPMEREVGRGTMLAGGVIQRDPIGGVLTSFSNGAKSLALIAAAEWFSQVQAGAAVPDRAALAAAPGARSSLVLSEAGREGIFSWTGGNQSALVTADPAQGVVVAPASDPTGVSGVWVRKFSGPLSVRWFGATGDGTTNDGAAFVNALRWLAVTAANVSGSYRASARLFVPAGHYYLGTTTLDITQTLIVEGESTGMMGTAQGTKLRWAAGATGIRVQRYNTSLASTVDTATHFAGDGTMLRGLHLYGGYSSSEGEYHGIHAKARVTIDHCAVENFQGDGLYVEASAGAGAPSEGNANMCQVLGGSFRGNRNGIYFAGADANICSIVGSDVGVNRRWGVFDKSFLGNSYFGCHAEANGIVPGTIPTVVSYNGNRYCVRKDQGAAASTNPPTGTTADNVWWYCIGAGGPAAGLNIPAWTSGATYRDGGSYRSDGGGNANNLFSGCYIESGQGFAQLDGPALVTGGSMRPNVKGVPVLFASSSAIASTGNISGANLSCGGNDHVFGSDSAVDPIINLRTGATETGFYSWRNGALDGYFRNVLGIYYLNGINGIRLRCGGVEVAELGAGGMAVSGVLLATGAMGYNSGAGGAVTQATSKSTGVSLNKVCGQITTSAASLAAGASISFSVSNSQVAATDTIDLVLAGGNAATGSYTYQIDKVSAGAFSVAIKNVSAGALAEALTFNFAVAKAVAA